MKLQPLAVSFLALLTQVACDDLPLAYAGAFGVGIDGCGAGCCGDAGCGCGVGGG